MITYLKGKVENTSENQLVLDVNGVGYSLICSTKTIEELTDKSDFVKVYTLLNVREDSWTLFGFYSERERFWFNKLNSVQGVGGKVAIAILSALSEEEIYNAFLQEDKKAFTKADGVGLKLSTRIISELKDKIVGKVEIPVIQDSTKNSATMNDVISALMNLGYQRINIMRAISIIDNAENLEFDVLLRKTLNKLSSGV